EALDSLASADASGLEPLHVEDAAEDLVLNLGIVARVERRVADDGNILALKLLRCAHGKRERSRRRRKALDLEQRHVPVRMDQYDPPDVQQMGCPAVPLRLEVELRRATGLEAQLPQTQTRGEELRDVAIRHEKSGARDPGRAAVR